ncbi:MAG: caspase family protein [Vicingus serpentipes]|nr:caspase family protein [Vicingus serpentipes]
MIRLLAIFLFFVPVLSVFGQQETLKVIVQGGHYAPVTSIDYSKDGNFIVTGSQDKTIKLWEASSGREIRTFNGHTQPLTNVAFSPDGTKIVSVGYDQIAHVWDVEKGTLLTSFKDSLDEIRNAIFTPDGTQILTGGHHTNAILWGLNGKKIKEFRQKPSTCYQCIPSLQFNKDGSKLITGSGDRTAIIWDVKTTDTVRTFQFTPGSCSSCKSSAALSSNEKYIASGEGSGQLNIIDVQTGKILQKLVDDEDFKSVQFSSDNKYLAAVLGYYGVLKVWDVKSGKELLSVKNEKGIKDVAFSPNGKNIAVANTNHTASVWDIDKKEELLVLQGVVNRPPTPRLNDSQQYYLDKLNEVELSPDGNTLAFFKRSKNVVLWDLNTGKANKKLVGHEELVTCLSFDPTSKIIATGSLDRSIILWDATSGQIIKKLEGHSAMLFSVKFSKDGKQLVSNSWDGTSVIWDVDKKEIISRFKMHDGSPYSASITPNGLYLITGGLDKTLRFSEIDTRAQVKEFIGHTEVVGDICFGSDDHIFATAGWDRKVKIWDVNSGLQIKKLVGHEGAVFSIDIDNKDQYIVSGSDDKTAVLWDFKTGKYIKTFSGHNGAITYVKITPDAKRLITSSRDGSVKIWDIESGEEILTHFSLTENEWLVKTPKGYFDATGLAQQNLFFVNGIKTYSLDQFFDKYYQPGIMQKALKNDDLNEDRQGNIIYDLQKSPPPTVTILSPFEDKENKERGLELIVKITNNGGGINEIKVTQNGKRIHFNDNLSRIPGKGNDMTKNYNLLLLPGENIITVSAFSDGRIESKKETVKVIYQGSKKVANCYILAVGINEYKNTELNLNYAQADASGFVTSVSKNGEELYENVFIKTIYNSEATREHILSVVDSISQKVRPEDVFIFYYAGHGGVSEGEFYFIPTDNVSLYQKIKLDKSAISASLLQENLRKIKALKQIVLLDACHAGASTEILSQRGSSSEKALAQMSRSEGIHVLAAAGSEQQATEYGSLGHGVFTYVLMEAINGKADGAPKDGKVTIYELISYLDDQVPEISQKFQGKAQYPYTFSLGHDFPITITK